MEFDPLPLLPGTIGHAHRGDQNVSRGFIANGQMFQIMQPNHTMHAMHGMALF